jgi:hypothetical protein
MDLDWDFNPFYREHLKNDVWLMDDHKWAFFIWEQYRDKLQENDRFELAHMDYHWDAVNDFLEKSEQDELSAISDLAVLEALVSEDIGKIRKDSFIAAAIIRRLIKKVRFHCLQSDELALDDELIQTYDCEQYIYENESALVKSIDFKNSLICDLCLDLFNRSDMWEEGDLWPDKAIIGYLESIRTLITAATVCTVSMSFGYSGSREDTRHLAQLVVPRILEMRTKS